MSKVDGVEISGDFRARLESDFESRRGDGSERDDRARARLRIRLGLDYQAGEHFSFGLRLRSGSDASHQSPHITVFDFNDNDTGKVDFNFDKLYLEAKVKQGRVWLGRNSFPFWKQNELFWDDDVTPAGLGLVFRTTVGSRGTLGLQGGYFSLPVGMTEFAGHLGAVQLMYSNSTVTFATGLLSFDSNPRDGDAAALLRGNGARDYDIWVVSVQGRVKVGRGLTLGVDVMHNSEDYALSDPNPFTAANRNEVDGYMFSTQYGALKGAERWLVAYTYAHIEAFAVHSSYAQDDWVRWGSAAETRASPGSSA